MSVGALAESRRSCPTTEQPDHVVARFSRILRHAIVDIYRARAAEARKTEAFEKELIAVGGDRSPAPDELQPTICACLERLPPALRLAYADLLRRIDLAGQSPEQVAQALQITQNNLTVRVHRARQALQPSLEQTCGLCTKHGWMGALHLRAEGRARAIVTLGWPYSLVRSLAGAKKVLAWHPLY